MKDLLIDIQKYYTKKILQYGILPKGVDWKDEYSQFVRFEQLLKIVDNQSNFTINDLGCGYGKLYEYMTNSKYKISNYFGYDLSEEMIVRALELYSKNSNAYFQKINHPNEMSEADITIASGIFNVKMHYKESEWIDYIKNTLNTMNLKSKDGFSFNILTKYSDKEFMKDYLYYADPCCFFDYCKCNFSKNVSLLHDYKLYEFTILVRKF